MKPDSGTARPKLSFAELGVTKPIIDALTDAKIKMPFAIQELAIPIAISGADMIGQARTGTGKTLAYGIPLLQHLILPDSEDFAEFEHYGKPQALILAPTRELAMQVTNEIKVAGANLGMRIITIYGGVGYEDQLGALTDGVEVVVGTPGRLLDLIDRGDLDLQHVHTVVLDEADEMLDLGFLPDVERIVSMTPDTRQGLLFSATMPAAIASLARSWLKQPVRVRAEGQDAQATVPDTTQFIYQAHDLDKPEIIGKLLQSPTVEKMMIFTRTKRAAHRFVDELKDRGFNAAGLHGDMNQAMRERTLKRFRKGNLKVLVATDVAARGIDVTGVSHVVNLECPDDAHQYVHRIGRTGRAGESGVAVTLVDWQDTVRWKVINKALDLNFDDPVESYSTSPHLLADLKIPEDVTGRIKPAEDTKSEPRRSRTRKPHHKDQPSEKPRERNRTKERRPRRRIRRRNGQIINPQDQDQ